MHRRLGAARNQIIKTFARADFAHAMMFVDEVATAAEAAGHHPDPDINIRWNQITLALSSHAEGGLTERDFQLGAVSRSSTGPLPRLTTGSTGHVVAGLGTPARRGYLAVRWGIPQSGTR